MTGLLAWVTASSSGRHAEGAPLTNVRRTRWDTAKTAEAGLLQQTEPGWMIWYGTWSRRFYAIATWDAPSPGLLDATTPRQLRDRMRQTEHAATRTPHHRRSAA